MKSVHLIPSAARQRGANLIAGAAILYLILRLVGFHKFFENDAEGVGALLQIIGTLYSVVYAFAIYVIWGQFTAVESEIQKESGALKDLLVFSQRLKETMRESIVRAVKTYARAVVESEWSELSAGEDTGKTDKLFSGVISSVTEMKPGDDAERILYQRLLGIANQASSHRDERLALSAKRMPGTLRVFVTLNASMILFLLFFFPSITLPSDWSPSRLRPCSYSSRTSCSPTWIIPSKEPGTSARNPSRSWSRSFDSLRRSATLVMKSRNRGAQQEARGERETSVTCEFSSTSRLSCRDRQETAHHPRRPYTADTFLPS